MAIQQVRDVITYAHVRELDPKMWVDIGLSARTPGPGFGKALLLVRRIDGTLQKWVFAPGAVYWISEAGVFIRGEIHTPIPTV